MHPALDVNVRTFDEDNDRIRSLTKPYFGSCKSKRRPDTDTLVGDGRATVRRMVNVANTIYHSKLKMPPSMMIRSLRPGLAKIVDKHDVAFGYAMSGIEQITFIRRCGNAEVGGVAFQDWSEFLVREIEKAQG